MDIPIDRGIREKLAALAAHKYPREACGIIDAGTIVESPNQAIEEADSFTIAVEILAKAKSDRPIVWHSHSHDRGWSMADIKVAKRLNLPNYLISLPTGKEEYYDPAEILPYEGREWSNWIRDCYQLVRDWWQQENGILLPDVERFAPHEEQGGLVYAWERQDVFTPLLQKHCVLVPPNDLGEPTLETGDLILLSYSSQIPDHIGIYCADTNRILHHLRGRLSGWQIYGQGLRDRTNSAWRPTIVG